MTPTFIIGQRVRIKGRHPFRGCTGEYIGQERTLFGVAHKVKIDETGQEFDLIFDENIEAIQADLGLHGQERLAD